jgi:Flp pilus assembly pilin Flp
MPDRMNGRGQMSRIQIAIKNRIEWLKQFAHENGQTLVEYGMIVALLSIVVIGVLTLTGQDVVGLFTKVSSDFQEIESRTP